MNGGRPVPAEDEVVGLDGIAIRELDVVLHLEGVGQPVGRDLRGSRSDVGDLVQLVVELVEAGVGVAEDVDVDGRRHGARVEVADVVHDREAEGLVRGEVLGRGGVPRSARRHHRNCSHRHGEGTKHCDSRHTTSYETRLEEGALKHSLHDIHRPLPASERGESAPATDICHLPMAPLLRPQS